jgi:hypothetical protein
MKKTFELWETFDRHLDKEAFFQAKKQYCNAIINNDFSIQKSKNLVDIIESIKRNPSKIGPYKNLTPFEVLNRIGSDLVLLAGAEKLFNNEISSIELDTIKLNMGNKGGPDIEIITQEGETVYGEAFNAAASFCKQKMRSCINIILNRLKEPNVSVAQAVIFYNNDIESNVSKDNYFNKREEELNKKEVIINIHRIACDYKKVVNFNVK